MISHPAYSVEPWAVRETELDLDVLAQAESVFALANGHIGLRGNLDEGEPFGPAGHLPQLLLRAAPAALRGGRLRLPRVGPDDRQRDQRQDHPPARRRRAASTCATASCAATSACSTSAPACCDAVPTGVSPAGTAVRVRSTRLVSFVQRAVAADRSTRSSRSTARVRVVVQSELVANEPMPAAAADPARRGRAGRRRCVSEEFSDRDAARRARALDPQRASCGWRRAWTTSIEGPPGTETADGEQRGPRARHVAADLEPGERLRMVKFLAYGWSSRRSHAGAARPGRRRAGRGAAHRLGRDCVAEQRAYLDDFWERADVELDGDTELQQAVRFALFHTLQAGARAERRAIAGQGADRPRLRRAHLLGHRDASSCRCSPTPRRTRPATRCAGATRRSTSRASGPAQLGLDGAAFPWRTIRGAGVLGLLAGGHGRVPHRRRHRRRRRPLPGRDRRRGVRARGRPRAARRDRAALALARPPRRRRALPHRRRHRPRRVQRDRRQQRLHQPAWRSGTCAPAADAVARHPDRAAALGADLEEAAAWRDAAQAMVDPLRRGSSASTRSPRASPSHQPWDFEHTAPEQYPLLLHFPYFDLYRKQVVKQADLVLALHLRGDAFTDEEKARDFAYYEALTVRDSSLSACTQAVIAAEVGHLELAYDYFAEAALMDLRRPRAQHPRRRCTSPRWPGAWIAAVAGFGGMRDHDGELDLRAAPATAADAPRLPHLLPRPASAGRGHPRPGPLLAPAGIASADHPPRPDHHRHHGPTGDPPDHRDRRRQAAKATDGTPPDSATSTRVAARESGVRLREAVMTNLTIDALERWVLFGAQWRIVDLSGESAVVDLCTCTGELVERLESDDPALIRYLRSAQPDPD